MGTGTVGRECPGIMKNAAGGTPIECLAVEKEQIPVMKPLYLYESSDQGREGASAAAGA